MADTKQRNRSVDFFKGIAILAIVSIHVITLHPREQALDITTNLLTEFLYAGILTFFLVSGYFYRPKDPGAVILRVLKLLIAVMLCIVVCTTLIWGYLNLLGQPMEADILLKTLMDELSGGVPLFEVPSPWGATTSSACFIAVGYYFLWSFAIATLLFYAMVKKSLESNRNMVIAIAILVGITVIYFQFIHLTLPFYLQLVPMEVAFMLVGAWMGQRRVVEKMESDWKNPSLLILVAISVIMGCVLITLFPTGTRFNSSYMGAYGGLSAISFFFIGLFASFAIMYLCSLLARIKYASDVFIFVGKYTLQILLLSTFYVKLLCAPFYEIPQAFTFPSMSLPVCFAMVIGSVALSIITTYAVRYVIKAIREKKQGSVQ